MTRIKYIITALLLVLSLIIYMQHERINGLVSEKQTLKEGLEKSNRTLEKLRDDITLMNKAVENAEHEKKINNAASQERQVIIKTVLQTEQCNTQLVPAAVSDSLHQQASELYSTGTDSR